MGSALMCGYGCGARATVDFLWPSDAEVWHVCDEHAKALQEMLDQQIGSEWAARVVRWPTQSEHDESGSPRIASPAPHDADDGGCSTAGRLGDRLWPLLWSIRNWLTRGR
jgi:hypothetical protein